ncbi:MAG: hypothetical protein WKF96_07445 [Solirubrobacteraceae bacterium]
MTRTVRSALATAGSFDRAAAAVAAALLVLLAGSTLAVAAPIGQQAAPPTVLTLQLAVDVSAAARFAHAPSEDAFARAQPRSTFTLVVPRPRLDASVRAVLAAAPASAAQHQAMADAFAATGMFDNPSDNSLDALRTELTDTEVVFRGSFKHTYPWTIERGSACQIRLDSRVVTRSTVPALGEVRAKVVFTGAHPASAKPVPRSLQRGAVEWIFGPRSSVSEVCTAPAPALVLPTDPSTRGLASRLLYILQTLLLAIPTTTLLLLGVRWALPRTATASPRLQQARRLASAILVLPIAIVLARGLQSSWVAWNPSTDVAVQRLAETFATALAAAAIVGGVSYCANLTLQEDRAVPGAPTPPRSRRRKTARVLVVAFAAIVVALLPVAALAVSPGDSFAGDSLLRSDLLSSTPKRLVLLFASILVASVIAMFLVATAWRGFRLAIPTRAAERVDRTLGVKWRRGITGALVLLIVGLSAERTIEELQRVGGDFQGSGGLLEAIVAGDVISQRYFDVLARWPSELIVNMAQAAAYLLPLSVVLAVGYGLLADKTASGQSRLVLDRHAGRAVAVLFAGGVIVAGTGSVNLLPAAIDARAAGSTVDRFFVPIGLFLLGVITISLILSWYRRTLTREQPPTNEERGQRLRDMALGEAARRRRQQAYNDFLADKIRAADYFKEESASPDSQDVGLSRGPHPDWRQNARQALEYGAKLAVIPVAYVAYVSLANIPRTLSTPLAPAYLVANLFAEILFWLILAFTFGALYAYLPRRHGMFKGAALGALVFIPHAVIAIVLPGREIAASWLFVVAEVTVFGMILGVLIDLATLGSHNMYWRHLLDIYRVRTLRVVVGYGLPFGVAIATIVAELISGNASDAAVELAKTASSLR